MSVKWEPYPGNEKWQQWCIEHSPFATWRCGDDIVWSEDEEDELEEPDIWCSKPLGVCPHCGAPMQGPAREQWEKEFRAIYDTYKVAYANRRKLAESPCGQAVLDALYIKAEESSA